MAVRCQAEIRSEQNMMDIEKGIPGDMYISRDTATHTSRMEEGQKSNFFQRSASRLRCRAVREGPLHWEALLKCGVIGLGRCFVCTGK
jgi:hypothetical protein